jgi:hypothetical protein
VFSGADGYALYTLDGDSAEDSFGTSVSGAGDVNADGFADLIVGAPGDDNNGTSSGSARVFSGFSIHPPAFWTYGRGCPSSNGSPPLIGSVGRPVFGQTFSLTLRSAPPRASAVINLGIARSDLDLTPFGAPGCRALARALVSLTRTTSRAGNARVVIALPNDASLLGGVSFAQWLVLDTANALGVITSNGAGVRIGRR